MENKNVVAINEMAKEKVAVYIRNGGAEGVQGKIDKLEKYCELRNYEICNTYVEFASGVSEERPILEKLINNKNSKYKKVIFCKLSDLSRNFSHLDKVLCRFEEKGIAIETIDGFIPNRATSDFFRKLINIFSTLEKEETEELF